MSCINCGYIDDVDGSSPENAMPIWVCVKHPSFSNLKHFPFKNKQPCWQPSSVYVAEILLKLERAVMDGQKEIENGDVCRHQLTDKTFSEIVSPDMEDLFINILHRSGRWTRGTNGFSVAT